MKVVLPITRSDTIGGAQAYVANLARYLLDQGDDAEVHVGGSGPLVDRLHSMSVPTVTMENLSNEASLPKRDVITSIRQNLERIQPDVISVHSTKAGALFRVVAKQLKIPIVYTVHGWSFTEGKGFAPRVGFAALEKALGPLADHIIVVSEFDLALAQRLRIKRPDAITAIHNGVADVDPTLLADPAISPPTIAMVARIDDQKDHTTALRALAGIKKPWRLNLIGDGPRETEMRTLATDLGIGDRVTFSGLREDVPTLLAQSQAFLLTTNWEGLPLSILEAMRAQLPVVATGVGGVAEAVDDSVTGFVVPPQDIGATRGALEQLLHSAELRTTMGRAGRELYLANFQAEHQFSKVRDVLASTVGASR